MSKPVCINITIAESPGGGRQRRERLPSRVPCLHVLGSAQLRCAVRLETEAELAEKSRCVCVFGYPEPIPCSYFQVVHAQRVPLVCVEAARSPPAAGTEIFHMHTCPHCRDAD